MVLAYETGPVFPCFVPKFNLHLAESLDTRLDMVGMELTRGLLSQLMMGMVPLLWSKFVMYILPVRSVPRKGGRGIVLVC